MTPGAKVRALIEELGLDQIRFAEKTDVSRQTISNIVNGHQTISREMANKLARMTGRTPGYWLQDEFPDHGAPPSHSAAPATSPFLPGIMVDHQILKAIEDRLIDIDPFDPELLQSSSVDLRLNAFVITASGKTEDISGERNFVLKPGQAVNVQTKESIRLANSLVARVGAMTSVARYGIVMAHGFQIDPGFEGHLEFCLFNASNKDYVLASGAPMISIEFTALSERPSGKTSTRDRDRGDVIEHFGGDIPSAECDVLIREALRPRVKTFVRQDGVFAEVPELDIRQRNRTARAAADDAIHEMLTTLRASLAQTRYRELRARYQNFFEEVAEELFCDANDLRVIARGLRYAINDNIIDFGGDNFLPLPQGSAEVSLAWLASKIGIAPSELIVRLTRPTKPPTAFATAQASA